MRQTKFTVVNEQDVIVTFVELDEGSSWQPGEGLRLRAFDRQDELATFPASVANVTLDMAKDALRSLVEQKRIELERLGVTFTFPDGLTSTIQTRNETDTRNILANTTAALVQQSMGVTEPVMLFRAEDDVNHPLTPAQAIALGMAVASRGQALYQAKWTHAAQIGALDSIAACLAYDIEQGWE